ncbi:MunI family type II restriction endonuclease [Caviibacterium pharyngocola]|uniref:Restriction endonuclease n=1 Tax=Caviibacterium pharyngocola TaxID=28159 RepID=A0A2M8RW16_9PAST|nr:MunI family type II restriction endonuclease [Caviibacterium pharyngocola]PJG83087.1 restriction endonuclease [Caviibacterium pharyngocola]
MASNELRKRSNWQTISGRKALKTEDMFTTALQNALNAVYPDQFEVISHPKNFTTIYSEQQLPQDVLNEIYNVDTSKYRWGIRMDFAIKNKLNGKTLFGEIKRQDGWVEELDPSAGRGNAHERSCKYFTPGILDLLRKESKIESQDILPFWLVLVGNITRDPKRNREIAFWYKGYEKNFYMWRNTEDIGSMLDFFENNLLSYLCDHK